VKAILEAAKRDQGSSVATGLAGGRHFRQGIRKLAFNLDTPDTPNNPIKNALVFKANQDSALDYMISHKKENPEIANFIRDTLDFTQNDDDYVLVADLYQQYREKTNSWTGASRPWFTRRVKEAFGELGYKQKKINSNPELVFTRCKLK
jgi:hypothetical protein